MAFANGHEKVGGRQAGTLNRRTQELARRLEEMNVDPAEGLARIAKAAEESGDLALAAKCYGDLMPYLWPKHKALEIRHQEETLAEMINGARKLIQSGQA